MSFLHASVVFIAGCRGTDRRCKGQRKPAFKGFRADSAIPLRSQSHGIVRFGAYLGEAIGMMRDSGNAFAPLRGWVEASLLLSTTTLQGVPPLPCYDQHNWIGCRCGSYTSYFPISTITARMCRAIRQYRALHFDCS